MCERDRVLVRMVHFIAVRASDAEARMRMREMSSLVSG